jgi:predicted RNA-binding Zn-ribbon protein involved in translation (DUF1610 family)
MNVALSILALVGGLVLLIFVMRQVRKWLGRMPELSLEKRREKAGLCHACGYNLKGVPSYQCPECGIVRLHPAPKNNKKTAEAAA